MPLSAYPVFSLTAFPLTNLSAAFLLFFIYFIYFIFFIFLTFLVFLISQS